MLIVSFIFLTTYISVYEQMGHNAGVANTVAARTRNIRQRLCWRNQHVSGWEHGGSYHWFLKQKHCWNGNKLQRLSHTIYLCQDQASSRWFITLPGWLLGKPVVVSQWGLNHWGPLWQWGCDTRVAVIQHESREQHHGSERRQQNFFQKVKLEKKILERYRGIKSVLKELDKGSESEWKWMEMRWKIMIRWINHPRDNLIKVWIYFNIFKKIWSIL